MICLGIRTKLFLVVAVCALTLAGFAWFMLDAAFAKRAWTILAVVAGIIVANVVVTLVIATSISRPLAALARRMGMLASGEVHTEIAERGRTDEIEAMAQASTIGHVSDAARQNGLSAGQLLGAAGALSGQARQLSRDVGAVPVSIRAA